MSNGSGRVPVLACVRDAWLFLRDNWKLFVPGAAAAAVISEIGTAAALLTAPGGGSALLTSGASFIMMIPMILAGLMFQAAVLRKAVREEYKPPTGLALGSDEGRLLGVGASITLLAIPVGLLLMVVFSMTIFRQMAATPEAMEALAADPNAFAAAMVEALGPFGSLMFGIVSIAVMAIVFGMVAIANAATIGERKIMIFQAWSWMGGNTLRVFAAMILTVLPMLILSAIVDQVVSAIFIGLAGGAVGVLTFLLASVLISFLSLLIGMPITALGAVLYRGLRPAELAAK